MSPHFYLKLGLMSFAACLVHQPFATAQMVPSDSSYYPLTLGASWTYQQDSSFTSVRTLTDTITVNGFLYYAFSWRGGGTEWIRKSNDSVFVIEEDLGNPEHLLYVFAAYSYFTYQIPPPYFCWYGTQISYLTRYDTVETMVGTITNCYHFQHQQANCADGGIFDTWFAKGIGMVKYRVNSIAGPRDNLLSSYVITSVTPSDPQIAELAISLDPNYPNPFNPTTVLQFRIAHGGLVTLEIFDILGRPVRTLVNDYREAGLHRVTWSGSGYPSGTYIAKLMSQGLAQTRMLVLSK